MRCRQDNIYEILDQLCVEFETSSHVQIISRSPIFCIYRLSILWPDSQFYKYFIFSWVIVAFMSFYHCMHCLPSWASALEASGEDISCMMRYPGASHMLRNHHCCCCCCRRRSSDLCLPPVSPWKCRTNSFQMWEEVWRMAVAGCVWILL